MMSVYPIAFMVCTIFSLRLVHIVGRGVGMNNMSFAVPFAFSTEMLPAWLSGLVHCLTNKGFIIL